ncbi:MAG: hypothetical protein JNK26_03985 [Candidatus Doudnabacteria bacterium]|nr:hypothetical protein [Candidatus Doudnabacteria bacterium]
MQNQSIIGRLLTKYRNFYDSVVRSNKRNQMLFYALVTGCIVLVLALGLYVFTLISRGDLDFSVAGEVANITLTPTGGTMTPNISQSIIMKANTGGAAVDGFQVFMDITGTIPADIDFVPANLSTQGLNLIIADIVDKTGGGKELKMLFITKDPLQPFTSTAMLELGRFTFTAPASGNMGLAFNTTLTKIIEHSSGANLAAYPTAQTYTFTAPSSSSSSSTSTSVSTTTSSSSSSTTTSVTVSTSSSSTSTSTSTTTSAPAGVACTPIDVNGDRFLDIVDFAQFAAKYNKNCSSRNDEPVVVLGASNVDFYVGEQVVLDLPAVSPGNNNSVDLDLLVTNAQIVNFQPTTAAGWLSPIGYCPGTNGATFTNTNLCAAMSKQTNMVNGELIGRLTIKFTQVGTVTIAPTANAAYSDGVTRTPLTTAPVVFTVGNPPSSTSSTTTSVTVSTSTSSSTSSSSSTTTSTPAPVYCGNQDGNKDSKINLVDCGALGRRYRKTNCGL